MNNARSFIISATPFLLVSALVTVSPRYSWASFTSAEYFPLQSGNTWTYSSSVTGSSFTQTVLEGATIINGTPTKARQNLASGQTEYYTSDANGIRLHRRFTPNLPTTGGALVDVEVTFNPPIQ